MTARRLRDPASRARRAGTGGPPRGGLSAQGFSGPRMGGQILTLGSASTYVDKTCLVGFSC